MPDMDGITATELITKSVPFAKIVILSVQSDPNYMRRAMLAGARDFLTKPPSVDELTSAIRSAGAKAREERAKSVQLLPDQLQAGVGALPSVTPTTSLGKIIVVYSPKGGVGCTTIATNLAVSLHNDETHVVLVDANLQFGDVAVFLNEQSKNSVADLTPRADELDPEIVQEVLLSHAPSGIKVLAAPFKPEYAENVTGEQLAKVLRYLRRMFAYVIVDTSSTLTDVTLGAIDASDVIILVTTQDIPAIKNSRVFLDLADALGIDRKRILFVMNRYDRRIGITAEKVSENFKHEIVATLPLDERVVVPAVNRGLPFMVNNKSQPISRGILALTEVIRQRLSQFEAVEEKAAPKKTGLVRK